MPAFHCYLALVLESSEADIFLAITAHIFPYFCSLKQYGRNLLLFQMWQLFTELKRVCLLLAYLSNLSSLQHCPIELSVAKELRTTILEYWLSEIDCWLYFFSPTDLFA